MTSLSEGNSLEMSWVILWRWWADINGNGADVSKPRMDRISWRMSTLSFLVMGDDCSRSKAGMLFCPR